MENNLLMSPLEVAKHIGLSRDTVYTLIRRGEIPSVRLGGSIRVPADQLRETIARKASTNAAVVAYERVP